MSNYAFLYHLEINELNSLFQVTTDNNLKLEIKKVLDKKINENNDSMNYSSSRTKYKSRKYEYEYKEFIKGLKIDDFDFIKRSFEEPGNSNTSSTLLRKYDPAIIAYGNNEFSEYLADYHNIRSCQSFIEFITRGRNNQLNEKELRRYVRICNDPWVFEEIHKAKYLSYLELFFKDESNIKLYEGTYNTYNYLLDYIYYLLINNIEDIDIDLERKIEIIKYEFNNIMTYLYTLRNNISDSRLSVGNSVIYRATQKIGNNYTDKENILINALAYGTSLEKLKEKDYSDMTRLIYVPKTILLRNMNK